MSPDRQGQGQGKSPLRQAYTQGSARRLTQALMAKHLFDLGDDLLGLIIQASGATSYLPLRGEEGHAAWEERISAIKQRRSSLRLTCKTLQEAFDACNEILECVWGPGRRDRTRPTDPSSLQPSSRSSAASPLAAALPDHLQIVLNIIWSTPKLATFKVHRPRDHDAPLTLPITIPDIVASMRHPATLRVLHLHHLQYLPASSPPDSPAASTSESLLGALTACHSLTDLYLFKAQLSDYSPLGKLAGSLLALDLKFCTIDDLRPLAPLRFLRRLNLSNTPLTDLGPLSPMTALEELQLGACEGVSNLGPLTALLNLRSLEVGDTGVTSLEPLASCCATLENLGVDCCTGITSIAPLSVCTRLRDLSMGLCKGVASLDPLASCTGLASLYLSMCRNVSSLAPLALCPGLTTLCITECRNIASLSPLASCPGLAILRMSKTRVDSLAPLASCLNLACISMSGYLGGILSLDPLSSCTNLTNLDASCNEISSLAPLSACTRLGALDLSMSRSVLDLSPLAGLVHLRELNVKGWVGTPDLSPLTSLKACKIHE